MKTISLFLFLYSIAFSACAQLDTSASRYVIDTSSNEGISLKKLDTISIIANAAIKAHAFPGCQVLVAHKGKVVYYKTFGYLNYDNFEPVQPGTIYDLASMTKTSATTMAIMRLYEEKKIDLDSTLGTYLPWMRGSNKDTLKLKDILLHQAGLMATIVFYRETIDNITGQPSPKLYRAMKNDTFSVRVADNLYLRNDWEDTIRKRIVDSKLLPFGKYVYSDNDFILLAKVAEEVSGEPIDSFVDKEFYKPLEMFSTTYRPREHFVPITHIAPTEKEKYFRMQLLRGDVHDPGAAMFGGVAGHAGLFSNAYDLSKLYMMLLNGGTWNGKPYFDSATVRFFTSYNSNVSRRGYGFDKPEKDNATNKDPYPSIYASPETFGHTGYTGTCVWADPKEDLLFIFLSNRVCPDGGANGLLSKLEVRRNMLNAVYRAMGR